MVDMINVGLQQLIFTIKVLPYSVTARGKVSAVHNTTQIISNF